MRQMHGLTISQQQAGFAETGIGQDLHVGEEVAILGISLFVLGLGEYDKSWVHTAAHHYYIQRVAHCWLAPFPKYMDEIPSTASRTSYSLHSRFRWRSHPIYVSRREYTHAQ